MAGIPQSVLVEPSLVHYPAFDGRPIPGFYYKPPTHSGGKLPVIVSVHGGPEGQSRPSFNAVTAYFVQRGYAVFAPNVRGSTGYGREFTHLDDVEKRMDSVADLKSAVEWLVAHGGADPKRVAVMGGSYGGFMTLAAITEYPDLWAAAVDIVGIGNFVTFLERTSAYRRKHRETEYGSLEHHRDVLERISPIHKVDRITAPMLVIHGANDPRVPVFEAEQMVQTLKARQHPVEYLRFEDEGHGIVKLVNKIVAYGAIGDFLDKYLASLHRETRL
jgi:dipeptidyl aminopeptidase/acylaminoacyl peptidase